MASSSSASSASTSPAAPSAPTTTNRLDVPMGGGFGSFSPFAGEIGEIPFPPVQPPHVVPIPCATDPTEDLKLKEMISPLFPSYSNQQMINLKDAAIPEWDTRLSPQLYSPMLYPVFPTYDHPPKVPDLFPQFPKPSMADVILQRSGQDYSLRGRGGPFPQSPPRKRRQYPTPYSPSEEKEGFEKCLRSKVFGYMFAHGHPKHLVDNVERFMEDLTQMYFQQANHNKCECPAGWKECECDGCRVCLLYQHVRNRGLDDLPYSELCPCPTCIYTATSMFDTLDEKKQALIRLFQKHRFHLSDRCNCKPPPPKMKRSGQNQCLLDLALSRLETIRVDALRLDNPLPFWMPGQFMY